MLMMLGRFGAGENAKTPLQLILILGRFGAWENAIAADAHDAGAVWGLGERHCS